MQEADLPEFASPLRSLPDEHPLEAVGSFERISQQYKGGMTPEFGDMDEEIPEPAISAPQPLEPLQTLPNPPQLSQTRTGFPSKPDQPHPSETENPSKRPLSHSFSALVPPIPEETCKEEGQIDSFSQSSPLDSLLIDLYRYTSQTGGRVSTQLKSRIAQMVSQFAARAHNLPVPTVKSKVKRQIQGQPKPPTKRNDPLGDLNKAIEGFTVKIAGDIQRIKSPAPVTHVVVSAFLELLREIGNLELLMHPHRTMWEVLLLLMQQPGVAVTLVRSLPKHIKAGDISQSKGYSEQADLCKLLLEEIASVDLYAVDSVGASLAIYNVVNMAIGYYDSLGLDSLPKSHKEEAGRLSKKMMANQGKFIAKMLTRGRDVRKYVPLRGKTVPIEEEEVPQPEVMTAQPYPLAID